VILVFDGQCLLCNGSVRFLLKHDHREVFKFATIQGQAGRALLARSGLTIDGLETFLLVDGDQVLQQSEAILRVLDVLGWPWRAASIAWLIPARLRNAIYRLIARNRYRMFGRSDICLLPTAADADRFLD
jgi:predicted DCC family thiol-disulfide oxidoreductase YuxK